MFLGTIGVPTIGLVLLIALPFIDLRRERRLSRRPVAVVAFILVVLSMGDADVEGRDRQGALERRRPAEVAAGQWGCRRRRPARREARRDAGCLHCHTYDGDGSSNLGAPDLTAIGTTQPAIRRSSSSYVANPRKFGNTTMPLFASLGQEKLAPDRPSSSTHSKGAK